jgi:tRNA-binding EMAP/Myf-like protein
MQLRHDPNAPAAPVISFDEFLRVDIRVGTIIEVDEFPEAKRPALKLTIDFGSVIGRKRSSAQIVANYRREDLVGKQVAAVVNFPSPEGSHESNPALKCWVDFQKDVRPAAQNLSTAIVAPGRKSKRY